MTIYKTLNGEVFNLDELTAEQKAVYAEVKSSYDTNVEWTEFTNLWLAKVRKALSDKTPSSLAEEPIYKICQDLESRLGVRQGYTREPDYRDQLAEIISMHFGSRYRFCKQMGLDEGYVSSVLNRKKNLSLVKLTDILKRVNYRIALIEKIGAAKRV